jgi:hypothetical protein
MRPQLRAVRKRHSHLRRRKNQTWKTVTATMTIHEKPYP